MSRTRKPPQKTPSERLRGVFFQLHEKEKSKIPFDDYYNSKMELLIEHYKKLIEKV